MDIDEWEVLPCGCNVGVGIVDGQKSFIIKPCSLTCKYYLYTIAETKKQGKKVIPK